MDAWIFLITGEEIPISFIYFSLLVRFLSNVAPAWVFQIHIKLRCIYLIFFIFITYESFEYTSQYRESNKNKGKDNLSPLKVAVIGG